MNHKLFLISCMGLMLSCKSTKRSRGITDPLNSPSTENLSPAEPLKATASETCLPLGEGHYAFELSFREKAYSLKVKQFADTGCKESEGQFFQSGTFEEVEDSEKMSTELTLAPDSEAFLYGKGMPESLLKCSHTARHFRTVFQLGTQASCSLPLEKHKGKRFRVDRYYGLRKFEIHLDRLKYFFPKIDPYVKWASSGHGVPESIRTPEDLVCLALNDHKFENGRCVPIDYVKADRESLIEFERSTGLYPRLVNFYQELGDSNEKNVSYSIPFRFPCKLSDKSGAKVDISQWNRSLRFELRGSAGQVGFDVKPSDDDTETVAVLNGSGRLSLEQLQISTIPTQLLRLQADLNCRLLLGSIKTTPQP